MSTDMLRRLTNCRLLLLQKTTDRRSIATHENGRPKDWAGPTVTRWFRL